jgi:uncharacterized protein YgiM (DUF1202 family)
MAFTLMLLMVFALASPALAASQTMVTKTPTQVYSYPSQQSANVIGKLEKNAIVTTTGTTGLWSIIEYNGAIAYVLTSRLDKYTGSAGSAGSAAGNAYVEEGGASSATTVYTTGTVNVRKGPGTNYSKIGQLSKGTAVNKIGGSGNWALIEWLDGVAYVSLNYLTSSGSGGSGTGSATGGNTMQATANVNVRKGPGTKYSIVGWLAKGETITKTGTSGKWTKVTYNNTTAYVSSTYLKAVSGGSDTGTGNSDGAMLLAARVETPVRTGPGFANSAVGYLDIGQTVTYLDSYGAWYRVQYGSHSNVYVYGPDMRVLGSNDTNSASGYVYALSSARVYSSASTGSATLGYLYAGDYARRTGVTGDFTRIEYGNATGYVLTSQITYSNAGTGDMTPINAYMYSAYSNAPCYTAPTTLGSPHGYLSYNERVYAIKGNSAWTQIQVSGYTLYTNTSNLRQYNGGTGTRYIFAFNDISTYTDYACNTQGNSIPANTEAVVLSYYPSFDTAAYVQWTEYKDGVFTTLNGYVKATALPYIYTK